MEKQIVFIPLAAKNAWDGVEVHPVIDENGICSICEAGEESFWSVYLHQIEGGVECIADLPTEELAYQFAFLLVTSVLSYQKSK